MKAKMRRIVVMALMVFTTGVTYSQFILSGEVRPRAEFRNGYKTLGDSTKKAAFFVSQRTRLNFKYDFEKIGFYVSLQDVRVWGNQSQLVSNEASSASLHEAWGLVKFGKKWGLKFGRQEVNYDDQRIFGAVGWAQQARSHDMLMFKFMGSRFKLDIAGAYNQDKRNLFSTVYTTTKSYKVESHVWANYNIKDKVKISALVMMLGQQVLYTDGNGIARDHDNYSLTMGTHVKFNPIKMLGGEFNAYYQLGSSATQTAQNIGAFNLKLDVFVKFAEKFKVTLGYEFLSGNSQVDTNTAYVNKQHAFTPFFGTNHKFNGHMDYFYVGNHVGNVGLQDIYLKFDYKAKKFNIGIAAHGFLSGAGVLDQAEFANSGEYKKMDSFLGLELDLYAGVKLAKWASLKMGYSQMLASTTMQAIKGGDRTQYQGWAYTMIILKPTFFNSKKFQEKKAAKAEGDK